MCGTTIPKEWPECSSNESPRLEAPEAGKARRASGHAGGLRSQVVQRHPVMRQQLGDPTRSLRR